MWLFPVLSIIVIAAIVAVLIQMALNPDVRIQLILSLLAWAVLLIIYFATKRIREKVPAEPAAAAPTGDAHRVLVLANETVEGDELIDELRKIDRAGDAEYFICVPANPIDTGQAMHAGAVYLWDKTTEAAQARLDRALELLRAANLDARGELGNYRPLRLAPLRHRRSCPGGVSEPSGGPRDRHRSGGRRLDRSLGVTATRSSTGE